MCIRRILEAFEQRKKTLLISAVLIFMSLHLAINMSMNMMGRYWGFQETLEVFAFFFLMQGAAFSVLLALKIDSYKACLAVALLTFTLSQYVSFLTPNINHLTLILFVAGAFAATFILCLNREVAGVALSAILAYNLLFCSYNGGLIAYLYAEKSYDVAALPAKQDILKGAGVADKENAPDIFIIFQDTMGDFATLNRIFGHDSRDYEQFLKDNNFYIASQARSYYTQTLLSISSTLNMNYFQDDVVLPHTDFFDNRPAINHFLRPRLIGFLRQQGYDVHMSSSAYNLDLTEKQNMADLRAPDFNMSAMATVRGSGIYYPLLNLLFGEKRTFLNPYRAMHSAVSQQYDFLRYQAAMDSKNPRLVYVHTMTPHPPFIFAEDGSFADYPYNDIFAYKDGVFHPRSNLYEGGWNNFYKKAYAAQVAYSQNEIMSFVQSLQDRKSGRPHVVIIQGDHGSRAGEDFSSLERSDKTELFGITNLIYFSDHDYRDLSDDISPINTMRVLFNKYFGTDLPHLDDKNWYSTWNKPYEFLAVSDEEQKASR